MIKVHSSWQDIVEESYFSLDKDYRRFLEKNSGYFPDFDNFLNAFKTLSLEDTRYILFGQDPYPRKESAIGYAFIDGLVDTIFAENGLSKRVNRATSLRNFIKMLLIVDGVLREEDTSQIAISKVDKRDYINSIYDLRDNFEKAGVLLLNTSLIYTDKQSTNLHVKQFLPFMDTLLSSLDYNKIELILFGNISKIIKKKIQISKKFKTFESMHPYNVGFIYDKEVHKFFKPMNLLRRD